MDKIQKFLAYNGKINITCVETTNLVEEARRVHDLSPLATATLGRCLTMASLMASGFKAEEDTLTLQIKGNGPIGPITVTADSKERVRGYVANPQVDMPLKENRNEILVASTKDEVCFRVHYSHKIMFITGKIYTFKAKGIFKDSEGKPIEVENKKLENDFTNGILSEINSIGFITKKMKLVLIVYKVQD